MNRWRVFVAPALVALAVFPLLNAEPSWSTTPGNTVFAVTTGSVLLRFDESAPGVIQAQSTITGLQMGESVLGIDFRPATGQLYGIGSTSRVYTIDPATGAATQVGSGPLPRPYQGASLAWTSTPRSTGSGW